MAMNKKEKQEMEELKIKCSLRFTDPVEKDVDIPDDYDTIVNGYGFNSYSMRIHKSCSSSIYHNNHEWDKTSSQQPIKQYSTELLALKAMRNKVENECAEKLRKIDVMIKDLEV